MHRARRLAFADPRAIAAGLGANAVAGADSDYEVIAKKGSMLLVSITGTAVTVRAGTGPEPDPTRSPTDRARARRRAGRPHARTEQPCRETPRGSRQALGRHKRAERQRRTRGSTRRPPKAFRKFFTK